MATYSGLAVSTVGAADTLVASLELTSIPPPSTLSSPLYTTAVSTTFLVTPAVYGFSLAAAPPSLTIQQGQTASSTISVSSLGGYTGIVLFTCLSQSALTACSIVPASLTLKSSTSVMSTTLVVKAAAPAMASGTPPIGPQAAARTMLLCWLPGGLLALNLCFERKRLAVQTKRILWMMVLVAAASGIVARSLPTPRPIGTSVITVNATGTGNISQSVHVGVNIIR